MKRASGYMFFITFFQSQIQQNPDDKEKKL